MSADRAMAAPRAVAYPAVLALAFSLTACAGDDADDAATATVDAPTESAEAGWETGDFVTASGTVVDVLAQTAIAVAVEDRVGEEVLVFTAPGAPFSELLGLPIEAIQEQAVAVEVVGSVREFDITEFEDVYGVVYDGPAFEPHEGEQVIVADQATPVTEQEVTASGEVLQVLSPAVFELGGSDWDVLVFDAGEARVEVGERVEVEATVREIALPELQNRFGAELDDDIFNLGAGDVGLVAEAVTPAGG